MTAARQSVLNTPRGPETVRQTLEAKVRNKTARVGILGLGYVGLPLAMEFVRAGFKVVGIDDNPRKVKSLQNGHSCVKDVPDTAIEAAMKSSSFQATRDISVIAELDTISICVPTPLLKTKDPDMSYIVAACDAIQRYLHPGLLVILESTTCPGTTEELLAPALTKTGLVLGESIFLCFSPERVDPGNPTYHTRNIPKVIGGVTARCTALGNLFYQQAMDTVIPVRSTKVAEMVKLLENAFRLINIGLVNELALLCRRIDVDIWDVIDAAATKPFGFMPFYPGPGLGGRCIPIDPFYLVWKAKDAGFESRFIELAGQINGQMPEAVARRIQDALNERQGKALKGARIHVVGVTYKKNVDDIRDSPAIDILHLLRQRGAIITYSDPYVPRIAIGEQILESQPIDGSAEAADCTVIVTDHSSVNYERLLRLSKLVVDTRNALKAFRSEKIVRL